MRTQNYFLSTSDRYAFDFGICSSKRGFAQVDTSQDASYFGIWANPFNLTVVTFCEGDVTTQMTDSEAEFKAEMERIKAWYEGMGFEFLGVDPGFDSNMKARFQELGLGDMLH
jgi:hypothetical protein